MDDLQYQNLERSLWWEKQRFKPCYKWMTFNTKEKYKIRQNDGKQF